MSEDGQQRRQPPKSSKNLENSFVQSLKTDWQMFWAGLVGDDEAAEVAVVTRDPFQEGRLSSLSLDQVRALTKVMSNDRKKLNQRMETIQREIDQNNEKLETLKLVGGAIDETISRLSDLSDMGQIISTELGRLDEKLSLARKREDLIRRELTS